MPTRNPSHLREIEKLELALGDDLLHPDTPIETVRDYLRLAGGDPERIRYEAAVLVDTALDQIESVPARARARRPAAMTYRRMGKEQLIRHVNALRANPAIDRALRSRLSNSSPDAISEEDLRSLLEEFESLFAEDDGEKDE